MKPGANLDPRKKAPVWNKENLAERVNSCRVMLVCHGYDALAHLLALRWAQEGIRREKDK